MIEPWTWHELSGDLLVAEMNRAGVDKAFLLGGGHGQPGDEYIKRFLTKYSNRFYWFANIPDPHLDDCLNRIERNFRDGARGIKVFPGIMKINLNDPAFLKVLELAKESQKIVIMCFGDPNLTKSLSAKFYINQLNSEILPSFPDLPFQLNHGGCLDPLSPEAEILFDTANLHSNLFLSTSFLGFMVSGRGLSDDEHEYPFPNQLRRLRKLYDRVGIEKLMFATDWPWPEKFRKYVQDVDSIRKYADFMTTNDKEKFLGLNASNLIGEVA